MKIESIHDTSLLRSLSSLSQRFFAKMFYHTGICKFSVIQLQNPFRKKKDKDYEIEIMADSKKLKVGSFGMEKMKQKDEEARLERMNTKQRRGTPTVRTLINNNEIIFNYILVAVLGTILVATKQLFLMAESAFVVICLQVLSSIF